MKRQLLLLLVLLATFGARAYDFEVDGIYYNALSKTDRTAEVTYWGLDHVGNPYSEYTGDILIPETVTYGGVTLTVTQIGYRAFSNCSRLTSVVIPNSVTEIQMSAFTRCYGLTSVVIGNSVTRIGDAAFQYCSGLTSVVIPNSVTEIQGSAFCGCSGLTSVVIPNSVTMIENSVFLRCFSMTSVEIPNSVTVIGGSAFCACSGLTSVEIPNSVTEIGGGAFRACSGLTSVVIPNSVTEIGSYAFQDCSSLTSVVIPNSVTRIKNGSFQGCSGLTEIVCLNTTPPSLTEGSFQDVNRFVCTIKVSAGSVALYQEAEGWKDFWNIVALTDEELQALDIKGTAASRKATEGEAYDLSGRRASGRGGIVIRQGRKMVAR